MRDMGVRGLLVLPTAVTRSYCRLEPVWNWRPLPLLQRLLRPAGNQFDGTTLRQWHQQRELPKDEFDGRVSSGRRCVG